MSSTISIDECLFGPDKTCPPTLDNHAAAPDRTPPRRAQEQVAPDRPQKHTSSSSKKHTINLQNLRRIVSQGICDKGSHRPVAWRVLLGYLPPDTSQWKELLKKERALYQTLVSEVFVFDPKNMDGNDLCGHHSKRVNEIMDKQRQQKEELLQDMEMTMTTTTSPVSLTTQDSETTDSLTRIETVMPGGKQIRRRASLGYTPTFAPQQILQRSKSLNDLSCHESHDLVSEHSDRTRELYITTHQGDRSERTRKFLKSIGIMQDGSNDGTPPQHNNNNNNVPVHTPDKLVPARIREQWKRSGRDQSALVRMSGGGNIRGLNTLLVVDNHGNTADGSRNVSVNNDPLSLKKQDEWHQFYENASLLDEIRKDVVRTHPDLFFFLDPKNDLGQRRYAAIERILFVWAKLNKGVRYVQGMNEIVGTLYYVLANDCNKDWACNAEADAYFLFNTLLVEMRDVFVPDLDEADTGIQGRISNLVSLLALHDPEVSAHLHDCGIDASFYAIRWLTTLLSREFLLPDTIRLWDSMFASTHKDNFLRYVCVTMVMIVRKDLLKGDFSTCLRLLQSYPPTNVDDLLESSRALWIYESQVTLACHKGGISLQKALHNIAPPPAILMAYGLPGGVTFKHSEKRTQSTGGEKDNNASSNSTRDPNKKGVGKSVSAQAAGFMSQAKGYLGDIGKRYKNAKPN